MKGKPSRYRKEVKGSLSSFQRQRGVVRPAKGVLIVTEGEETERVYFEAVKEALRIPAVEVEVVGTGFGDPLRLAQEALELQRRRKTDAKNGRLGFAQVESFDEVWIAFDTDTPRMQGVLQRGLTFAKNNGIRCASSTPCFEFWLLLHHERTTTGTLMDKKVLKRRLEGALGVGEYEKDRETALRILPPLMARLDVAEANAAWIRGEHTKAGTGLACEPCSEVDLLMASLRESLRR